MYKEKLKDYESPTVDLLKIKFEGIIDLLEGMKVFLVMLKKMCIFAAIFVGTRVPLFIAYDRQIQGFRPNKGCT